MKKALTKPLVSLWGRNHLAFSFKFPIIAGAFGVEVGGIPGSFNVTNNFLINNAPGPRPPRWKSLSRFTSFENPWPGEMMGAHQPLD